MILGRRNIPQTGSHAMFSLNPFPYREIFAITLASRRILRSDSFFIFGCVPNIMVVYLFAISVLGLPHAVAFRHYGFRDDPNNKAGLYPEGAQYY